MKWREIPDLAKFTIASGVFGSALNAGIAFFAFFNGEVGVFIYAVAVTFMSAMFAKIEYSNVSISRSHNRLVRSYKEELHQKNILLEACTNDYLNMQDELQRMKDAMP